MKSIFSEYILLQLDRELTRDWRNSKINELFKINTLSGIEVEELMEFENELEKLKINVTFPFFKKVYFPILEKGFQENNLEAIKLLIKHIQIVYYIERKRDTNTYSAFDLIDKGLLVSPADRELLEKKESALESYLDYSIHEVPSGVLYGNNGASQSQCQELLEILEEYKVLCKQLNRNRKELIEKCEFHFHHYKEFLTNRNNYKSYEAYLHKHYPEW